MEKFLQSVAPNYGANHPYWMKRDRELQKDGRHHGRLTTLHLGVITSVDPLLVTHRVKTDGPFVENEPVSKVTEQQLFGADKDMPVKVAFYYPYWKYSQSYSPFKLQNSAAKKWDFLTDLNLKIKEWIQIS